MKKFFIFFIAHLITLSSHAEDILIDSDKRLEWYRDEQIIIAIGNAVAQKTDDILKGDTLTAFYERVQLEDGTQKTQIQKVLADGNVVLINPKATGTGIHFEYDLPSQKATLTGKPAKIIIKQEAQTSTESNSHQGNKNKSSSPKDDTTQNPSYTVYAEKMISFFDEDKQGKQTLNRIEIYAQNNPVKIVNKQATVTGNRGTYFPKENKLKLFEKVTINQNGDVLNGDYAETDLKTGISRLLSTQKKGRVSGIFHNKKKK
jgi:lipopolysaccharide export system protein LptA